MERLKGSATAIIDSKGRVSLPAKYRKQLPEELVITKSPNEEFPALVLYSPDGFEKWMDEVLESKGGYRANDQSHDDVIDDYYEIAEDIRVDGVGRILIPQMLRDYAGIDKDMVFSGSRTHLTIRSIDVWNARQERRDPAKVYDEQPTQA